MSMDFEYNSIGKDRKPVLEMMAITGEDLANAYIFPDPIDKYVCQYPDQYF